MTKFIQLHILTSYPPSNLNRDDMGRPKTAKMGGVDRLRISSQSLKRSWRTSNTFKESISGKNGERTKFLGIVIFKYFTSKDIDFKKSLNWTQQIVSQFGDLGTPTDLSKYDENKKTDLLKKLQDKWRKWDDKKIKITGYTLEKLNQLNSIEWSQLVFVDNQEKARMFEIADQLIAGTIDEVKEILLRKKMTSVDVALFGRMLASNPGYNIEAACQVAHAISVHPVVIEDDYFTAVDDLNNNQIDSGAAHIGERGFASALFYHYICIDKELLIQNLDGSDGLANEAIKALIETAATISPSGMQNSFASRTRASYILAEKGSYQPRSLSVAFLKPVRGENHIEDSIEVLNNTSQNMNKVYEMTDVKQMEMNALTGEGKLSDIVKFCTEE